MINFDDAVLNECSNLHVVAAQPLMGGLTNTCWYLDIEFRDNQLRQQAVWRPISRTTQAFGLSRLNEYQTLEKISEVSLLAPRPFVLLSTGLLVEWIEGQSQPPLSSKELMHLLVQVHDLPKPDVSFNVQEKAEFYWCHLPNDVKTDALLQWHQDFQLATPKRFFDETCCHYDIGAHNVIKTELEGYRIIDWEYAAVGDPSFDLALTIFSHQLSMNSSVEEYCTFKGVANIHEWKSAVEYWLPWCHYLSTLWYLLSDSLAQHSAS